MPKSILMGGCLCGAVRYQVEGGPAVSGICHCRSCRKTASAPMLPFVTFSDAQFRFTDGTAAEFHSSPGVTRSFCSRCGSPLTYRNEMETGQIDVMTCSLDNPEAFPPTHHIWTSHKLAWVRLDGLAAYNQSSTDEQ